MGWPAHDAIGHLVGRRIPGTWDQYLPIGTP